MAGRFLLTVVVALGLAGPVAAAESLQLTIHAGHISLVANDVTVRQILAEWERVGRTHIVNGDRVPGGRITLELTNTSEREALDLLLRGVGGYVAAEREPAVSGASQYDRILILPTSTAPAAPTRAARPSTPPQTAVRTMFAPQPLQRPQAVHHLLGPDGLPIPDDQDGGPTLFVPLPPGFDGTTGAAELSRPGSAVPPVAQPGAPTVGSPIPGMLVPAPQPGQPLPK
jgi:hypothetical protein